MSNWAYMMSGHAGSIQVSKVDDIPMQSGSMIDEIIKTNSTPRQADGYYHVSKHLQAIWPNIWQKRLYTTLPRKTTSDYTYFFQYNTNNNTTIGYYSKVLSMEFKEVQQVRNWYVGSNIYFLDRAAHRGGYFNAVMGVATITINFFDGTSKIEKLEHSYCGINEQFTGAVCEAKGLRGTETKEIKSISVSFDYKNAGGEWHGSIRGEEAYETEMIKKGGNAFINQLLPDGMIDFIKEFNFTLGTVTDTVRPQKTIVF